MKFQKKKLKYLGTVKPFETAVKRFAYDGEKALYLNDIQEQKSAHISDENSYDFFATAEDEPHRFAISATPIGKPQTPTGIEGAVSNQTSDVRKLILDNHLYIFRAGKMYDACGARVK